MCLAFPGKIISIHKKKAQVDFNGEIREIDLSLLDAKKGDYIIANAGFAIKKVPENEAIETLKLLKHEI
ncbi:MAG: hypothetical protein MAG795_00134 [Candidatus Woesearchaeota archaeon]|nr:hypothetical protein [Candidatus Woesearchaeota archaeon]